MKFLNQLALEDLNKAVSRVEHQYEKYIAIEITDELNENFRTLIEEFNMCIYTSNQIVFDEKEQLSNNMVSRLKTMIPIWKQSLQRRMSTKLDNEFWTIYEYFQYVDRELIISNALKIFLAYPKEYQNYFISLPENYPFLTGKIDIEENDFSLISIYVNMMKEHLEDFKWLYEKLSDNRSKQILLGIVKYWFSFDLDALHGLHENLFADYYDLDIVSPVENEILVDCGAFIGDSIVSYVEIYGSYQKIYAYEIAEDTMSVLKKNLDIYSNIVYKQKGVGRKNELMYLAGKNAGAHVAESGEYPVQVVTIDDDIKEPITTIKMDIEGAEQDAIYGATKHIKNEKPRLLISAYHKPADIFEIPRLIDRIRGDYQYYLRINGLGIWPCDYVIFAV